MQNDLQLYENYVFSFGQMYPRRCSMCAHFRQKLLESHVADIGAEWCKLKSIDKRGDFASHTFDFQSNKINPYDFTQCSDFCLPELYR